VALASNDMTFILNFVKIRRLLKEMKEVTRNAVFLRLLNQDGQDGPDVWRVEKTRN
jgi:hypothetical protein